MNTLWFDCETYSEADLRTAGTHAYAEHPSTEITVAQWAIDDGEPQVADMTLDTGLRSIPDALWAAFHDPRVTVVAHNSHFDRTLIRNVWGIDVPVERWRDTMVQALAHGLPGGLDKVGQIVGLPADQAKDKRGRELIQLFCKPRPKGHTLRRATRETHPTEWREFLEYSRQDIVAMRAIHRRLPVWNLREGGAELALWHLDQRICDRGFAVDVGLAHAAIAAVAGETARLKQEVHDLTDGAVSSPSKRDELLVHILMEYGVSLPDMRADTLRRRLEDPELPEAVKLLLSLRLEATKTSTAKYKALVNATSGDGRLRNTLQFAGAQRTARWAGRVFQPQNMPRPDMDQADIDTGIEALKAGCAPLIFNDVMRLTANAVRGAIVAPPGRKLCIADLSNIEGRGLAVLAGETWKLKAFAEFDRGIGTDLYKLAYARAFNIDPAQVDKSLRQIGKVMELACLAGDTPVVTKAGIKPLVTVTEADEVWDGNQWVSHGGLVFRGVKPTLNLAGVKVTPDHLIKTGATWTQAQELVSNESILCQALATGSENSPCWASSGTSEAPARWTLFASSARAVLNRILCTTTTCAKGPAPAAERAREKKPAAGARSSLATPTSCLTKATACASSTAYPPVSTDATTKMTPATTATGAAEFLCTPRGERTAGSSSPIWSRLRAGTSRTLSWIAKKWTKATSQAICDSSPSKPTNKTVAKFENCKIESQTLRPVYDLLNAGPNHRFTVMTSRGPLLVHNCGYEGGVAAFLTFAAVYGLDLDMLANAVHASAPAEWLAKAREMLAWFKKQRRSTLGLSDHVWVACEALVLMWRDAHPATTALWKNVGEAVRNAIQEPGATFTVRDLKIRRDGAWLRIRLPSGRYLCYTQPAVDDGQISYMGINQYTRQWGRIKTYGGKISENVTQAWARDVLAANMPAVEAEGYQIVLTVHDELLTETPDTPEFNHQRLAALMATPPAWAPGAPLAAAGFETYRYRKD